MFDNVEQLVSHFEEKYGDSLKSLYIHERDREIVLDNIEVNTKNQGIGTEIINALQEYSQKVQKPITLAAEPQKRQKTKLDRFYRERGFKKPGRARRYDLMAGHSHIWNPNESIDHSLQPLSGSEVHHALMGRMDSALASAGINKW